jgi:hypothetical protein
MFMMKYLYMEPTLMPAFSAILLIFALAKILSSPDWSFLIWESATDKPGRE